MNNFKNLSQQYEKTETKNQSYTLFQQSLTINNGSSCCYNHHTGYSSYDYEVGEKNDEIIEKGGVEFQSNQYCLNGNKLKQSKQVRTPTISLQDTQKSDTLYDVMSQIDEYSMYNSSIYSIQHRLIQSYKNDQIFNLDDQIQSLDNQNNYQQQQNELLSLINQYGQNKAQTQSQEQTILRNTQISDFASESQQSTSMQVNNRKQGSKEITKLICQRISNKYEQLYQQIGNALEEKRNDCQAQKCNCEKSNCLKQYCQCFRVGQVCGPDCNCKGCYNNEEGQNLEIRKKAALKQQKRIKQKELFFVKKIETCNCSHSQCLKKYCQCFKNGLVCGVDCNCKGCLNHEQSDELKQIRIKRERKIKKKHSNQRSDYASNASKETQSTIERLSQADNMSVSCKKENCLGIKKIKL